MQHAWAAAVEAIDRLAQKEIGGLKSGLGDPKMRRFFALAASATAVKEGCARVPGTPADNAELLGELRSISEELRVLQKLRAVEIAAQEPARKNADQYLLVLDLAKHELVVEAYTAEQRSKATKDYEAIEKEIAGNPQASAVLVSVARLNQLKSAYPSFYMDTALFTAQIDATLEFGLPGTVVPNANPPAS